MTGKRTTYVIVVVDTAATPWRHRQLAEVVPLKVARAWQKQRLHFTNGIRRYAREARN